MMEINQEAIPRLPRRSGGGRRRSSTQVQTRGTNSQLRPDVDVVLSLKNPTYKAVMERFFRRLGDKKSTNGNDAEREAAREVLQLFKNRKRGEITRFFKPQSRHSSKSYVEVDDAAALEKITADIYRRMESAKRWMNPDKASDDDSSRKSPPPPQAQPKTPQDTMPEKETGNRTLTAATSSLSNRPPRNIPTEQTSTEPSPPKSTKNKKRKLLKKVPQSLPFLSNTHVADIIVEEEVLAESEIDSSKGQSPNDQISQPEEVINFFRGLYVHGWGEWTKVSKMIKTRNSRQVKSYAMKLENKSPELKKFFSSKQVRKMQEHHGVKVKRCGNNGVDVLGAKALGAKALGAKTLGAKDVGAKAPGGTAKQQLLASQNDPALIAASVMGSMKHEALMKLGKPNVVICVGDHIIDTATEPSLIRLSNDRKRPADTPADYFDPSVRPSVPMNRHQIYIPGNRVYARWLNKDDPGSYGTWYPGFINASKIAPTLGGHNFTGVSNLLYHVKFDDGAESLDLDKEDIMMQDQYQEWLKELEHYYSLPVTQEMTWKRLTKNTRVYAKWTDPTDPELHGSWMSGKVHSSQTGADDANPGHPSYHIFFDSGDQDEDLQGRDVLEEETYRKLISDKMERARKKYIWSGVDAIMEASKISSPIKVDPYRSDETAIGAPAKRKLDTEAPGASEAETNSLVEQSRCNNVLEFRSPNSSDSAHLQNTSSPGIHYGSYTNTTPWEVTLPLKITSSALQDQLKTEFTSTDASKLAQECHTEKAFVPRGSPGGTKLQPSASSNDCIDPNDKVEASGGYPKKQVSCVVDSQVPADDNMSLLEAETTFQSDTVNSSSIVPEVAKKTTDCAGQPNIANHTDVSSQLDLRFAPELVGTHASNSAEEENAPILPNASKTTLPEVTEKLTNAPVQAITSTASVVARVLAVKSNLIVDGEKLHTSARPNDCMDASNNTKAKHPGDDLKECPAFCSSKPHPNNKPSLPHVKHKPTRQTGAADSASAPVVVEKQTNTASQSITANTLNVANQPETTFTFATAHDARGENIPTLSGPINNATNAPEVAEKSADVTGQVSTSTAPVVAQVLAVVSHSISHDSNRHNEKQPLSLKNNGCMP